MCNPTELPTLQQARHALWVLFQNKQIQKVIVQHPTEYLVYQNSLTPGQAGINPEAHTHTHTQK